MHKWKGKKFKPKERLEFWHQAMELLTKDVIGAKKLVRSAQITGISRMIIDNVNKTFVKWM